MDVKVIGCILREYGIIWALNRCLYNMKLKVMNEMPKTEHLFEKKPEYPENLEIFDIDTDHLKRFLNKLDQNDRKRLIEDADRACNGIIKGFSYIDLDYGYPINWQLNPLTHKVCDEREKWYKIPDFDKARGDIKIIWEVSRFSHFILFARAYLLTGDRKYYKAFSEQLKDWLRKNPYSYGANYKCGQECSLRMVNTLLAFTIFKNCKVIEKVDENNVKQLVLRCYRKVLSNFFYAYKCIRNNHTISELMGMLIGSWCCGDEKQINLAKRLLNRVIAQQFTDDGGYIQYSFNYERLALQDVAVVLAVERKIGKVLEEVTREKILNAAKLMYQCQDEHGFMPNYGSNDGALVFPLTSCVYGDFRPIVNTIYTLLKKDKLYPIGKWDEELIWFGIKGESDFKYKYLRKVSSSFEQAGLYTLRQCDSWLMVVLNKYQWRPGHMDQMHIDLWVQGINVLCDGGTYSYANSLGEQLSLNQNHNTVSYSDKLQMGIKSPFFIYAWTKRERVKYNSRIFCGNMKSQNGYRHKREVRATGMGYQITDWIMGVNGEKYEVRFHTPCEIQRQGNKIKLIDNGKTVCSICFHNPFKICDSLRSLYYLQTEKINCIIVVGKIQNGEGLIKTEISIKEKDEDD